MHQLRGPGTPRGQGICLGSVSTCPSWSWKACRSPGLELAAPAAAWEQPSREVQPKAPPSPVRPELRMSNSGATPSEKELGPGVEGDMGWETWGC